MTIDKESSDPFQGLDGQTKIYRAPGRVNLIGEHTDYNDGFVMPGAIDLAIWVAVSAGSDGTISVSSENFHDQFSFE